MVGRHPRNYLFGSSYIDVDVTARFVQPGGEQGTTGLDGDTVGFALIVKGVTVIQEPTKTMTGTGC